MGTEEPPRPPRHGATEPIRPMQGPTEPIPERIRQPIVVPRRESTIGGLPRPLVLLAIGALLLALLAGFLIGRSFGGGDDAAPSAAQGSGKRAACQRALGLTLEIRELQTQALGNRTAAVEAATRGDDRQVQVLTADLEPLVVALRAAENRLPQLVERCQGGGEKRRGGGGKGKNRSQP